MADDRRRNVEKKIIETARIIDPSGTNAKRYMELFSGMDDKTFHSFMEDIRDKKRTLDIVAPNMIINLRNDDLFAAADYLGLELFERIWLYDPISDRRYLTPQKYLVITAPVRRLKQHLEDKMSVPESDRRISVTTGQVIQPDKGSSISIVEAQTLDSKGLHKAVSELINIRGGNIPGYAILRSRLEEEGMADLGQIDATTVVRSAVVAETYLKAMHLDNNLTGGRI